jgi:DNA-binding response OmpR family regulator
MDLDKQEQIRQVLQRLAASYAATMKLMELALALMEEEFSFEQQTPFQFGTRIKHQRSSRLEIDRSTLSVNYRGRPCFLGNTLMFRLIEQLAKRPNKYLPYEDLLADVWQCDRSDGAIRSVVKRLPGSLRGHGMEHIAQAIDGSVPGHYALRLPS